MKIENEIEQNLQTRLSAIQKTFMELEEKMFNEIYDKLQSRCPSELQNVTSTITTAKIHQQKEMDSLLKQLQEDSDDS